VESDWRNPLIDDINKGMVPEDEKEAKQLLKKATGSGRGTCLQERGFGTTVEVHRTL
jgi:hypothetical protein